VLALVGLAAGGVGVTLNRSTASEAPAEAPSPVRARSIPIDKIVVGTRLRGLRPDRLAALAESIATIGLRQPITVRVVYWTDESTRKPAEGYEVVAGLHRLEACRSLGHTEIEAEICTLADGQRQLWEIDENLCRVELTELERGEHLTKRKEIYEWLRPGTKRGGAPGKAGGGKEPKNDNLSSFAEVPRLRPASISARFNAQSAGPAASTPKSANRCGTCRMWQTAASSLTRSQR
jgi:uncharacterized ParB-like nuclease family protein